MAYFFPWSLRTFLIIQVILEHITSVQYVGVSLNSCSEVRLNEALENACSNVLDYKVHKDKVKALRYEKSK